MLVWAGTILALVVPSALAIDLGRRLLRFDLCRVQEQIATLKKLREELWQERQRRRWGGEQEWSNNILTIKVCAMALGSQDRRLQRGALGCLDSLPLSSLRRVWLATNVIHDRMYILSRFAKKEWLEEGQELVLREERNELPFLRDNQRKELAMYLKDVPTPLAVEILSWILRHSENPARVIASKSLREIYPQLEEHGCSFGLDELALLEKVLEQRERGEEDFIWWTLEGRVELEASGTFRGGYPQVRFTKGQEEDGDGSEDTILLRIGCYSAKGVSADDVYYLTSGERGAQLDVWVLKEDGISKVVMKVQ